MHTVVLHIIRSTQLPNTLTQKNYAHIVNHRYVPHIIELHTCKYTTLMRTIKLTQIVVHIDVLHTELSTPLLHTLFDLHTRLVHKHNLFLHKMLVTESNYTW